MLKAWLIVGLMFTLMAWAATSTTGLICLGIIGTGFAGGIIAEIICEAGRK